MREPVGAVSAGITLLRTAVMFSMLAASTSFSARMSASLVSLFIVRMRSDRPASSGTPSTWASSETFSSIEVARPVSMPSSRSEVPSVEA